jgi:hypothetical protein
MTNSHRVGIGGRSEDRAVAAFRFAAARIGPRV